MQIDLHKKFVKLKFRVLALRQSQRKTDYFQKPSCQFNRNCFLIDSVYIMKLKAKNKSTVFFRPFKIK